MSDDTSAALIAQLDVKFDQLANNMKKAISVFDNGGRQIEKRQAQIKKNLSNWAIDFSGLGGINKALVGLTAAGVVGGIGAIITKSLEAASAIGDVAQQAGVSVEFLQKIRFAASQSGASFDIMDMALTTLNKSLGDFVNTGAGKGASAFKQLGIDKLINGGQVRNAEQAFDAISKGLTRFGSEAQKSSLLAGVFGKEAGPKLLQLMEQGTDGIAKLEAQAVSLGIVLSTDTVKGAKDANDKFDALGSVIKAQVTGAVANLAPEIANLADQITKSLPDLILWVEKWADWFGIIKLSPVEKLKSDIKDVQAEITAADSAKASWFLNPLGLMSYNIDTKKAQLQQKLKGLQTDLALAPVTVSTNKFTVIDPKLNVASTAAEQALEQRRKELLAQTGVDAATASAALLVAQDQTNTQLLKGSADYYSAVQKQINDEYTAKVTTAQAEAAKQKATLGKQGTDWKGYADGVANINKTLTDKIATAAEEQKQKLDQVGPSSFVRDALIAGDQQIQQYRDETAALGLTSGAMAKLAYVQDQLNDAKERGIPLTAQELAQINAEGDAIGRAAQSSHQAAVASNDNIQALDSLRTGLSEVGIAGLHGFGSLKDAAGQFLDTLAQTIGQLYVMKPLLNGLFGEQGAKGSGILGSLLSSIPGFASGTNFAPGGLALVGERGPEIVNLPRGSQVVPNVPSIAARSGGGSTVYQQFDLRGAVVTEKLYDQMNAAAAAHATAAVSRFNARILPSRVAQLNRNPRAR